VVEAGRTNVNFEVDAELLRSLIDYMLWQHSLRDFIDGSKIGAWGLSFGGGAGFAASLFWNLDFYAPDLDNYDYYCGPQG